jgi:hypothetical protein
MGSKMPTASKAARSGSLPSRKTLAEVLDARTHDVLLRTAYV